MSLASKEDFEKDVNELLVRYENTGKNFFKQLKWRFKDSEEHWNYHMLMVCAAVAGHLHFDSLMAFDEPARAKVLTGFLQVLAAEVGGLGELVAPVPESTQ